MEHEARSITVIQRLEVYPRDVTPRAKPDTLLKGDRNEEIRWGR